MSAPRRAPAPPAGGDARPDGAGPVVVLGGGAWGTALALSAVRAGRTAVLLVRDPAAAAAVNAEHRNPHGLAAVTLDGALSATVDPAAVGGAVAVVAAVPAQAMRTALTPLARHLAAGTPVVSAAKGLERGSLARMTDVIAETLPAARPAVLSGPSFAADVAAGLPTAVTVAAADLAEAEALCRLFAGPAFRPYASDDPLGVELGGALKNVLAIAAGIVVGRGLGASAQAALIARGFAELARLAGRLGARPETAMGLSGLGDLVLSANSPTSRNFSLGLALGRGDGPFSGGLAEGAFTASVAVELAARHGVEVPISAAVADVLAGAVTVEAAASALMARPLKPETD
jgi:glycerol-3-phosphate dehydrogenase (NAD(P)+)